MRKKFMSAILAAAMACSMTVPAMAEDIEVIDTEETGGYAEADETTALDDSYMEEEELSEEGFVQIGSDPSQEATADEIVTVASISSGTCGENLTWILDEEGTLTISGSGDMETYESASDVPWYSLGDDIKKIVIEEGVTGIGEASFYDECNLEAVELPATLKSIGDGAFAGCTSLSDIELPAGLLSIGSYAFQECAITAITIPAGVSEIDPLSFYGCTSLESITVAEGNAGYMSEDGVVYNKAGDILVCMPAGKSGSFAIPETVTTLGESSFIWSALNSVSIPDSVTTLQDYVFCYSLLNSVEIPDSVVSAGDCVFECCDGLESASVGSGLTALGYRFFSECPYLTDVTLGENLEDLDYLTFAECISLEEITIPSKVKYIKNGTFGNCRSLKQISMPSTIEEIWYQAFFGCTSLTDISLPESLTKINRLAFYKTGLTSVYIPRYVQLIGENAFPENCTLTFASPESLEKQADGSYVRPEKLTVKVRQYYDMAYEVLKLVNQERSKEGLPALTMDGDLLDTAMQRAAETVISFSHTRPDNNDCFSASKKMCGENIATGGTTASAVMKQWMNSSGHRANILGEDYTSIGIGVVKYGSSYYWVQCFGQTEDSVDASSYQNQKVSAAVQLSEENKEYSFSCALAAAKIKVGATTKMTTTVDNGWTRHTMAASNMVFSSSNPSVATVTSDGVVSGTGAGTAVITAKLKNGTITRKAKIKVVLDTNIAHSVIKMDSSAIYTGKARKVSISVSLGGTVLKNKTDYTVQYSNNKNVGLAKVKITGTGKYTGTVTKTFNIVPEGTYISSLTASSKAFTAKWKKQVTQTTGYQIQYSTSSKFTSAKKVTIKQTDTRLQKVSKLSSGKKYYVRVRTYKKVSGKYYYSAWSRAKTITTK